MANEPSNPIIPVDSDENETVYAINGSSLTDIADAIREKIGSSDTYTPAEMAEAIAAIPSGSSVPEPPLNDVVFYDYDGTVLYSYSATEFLALTEMPPNPTRHGFTAQGWNWTYADARAHVTKYGELDIGQMYVTADGKTQVVLQAYPELLDYSIKIAVNGSVTLDWGDGSPTVTITGNSTENSALQTNTHTYAAPGEYTVTVNADDSETEYAVDMGSTRLPLRFYGGLGLVAARIANNPFLTIAMLPLSLTRYVNTGGDASSTALRHLTIPIAFTGRGNTGMAAKCEGVISLSIPKGMPVGTNAFSEMTRLRRITIPDGITSAPSYGFSSTESLLHILIPDTVGTIPNHGVEIHQSNASIKYIKFFTQTPPTAGASGSFKIPTSCVIMCPSGSLNDYKTATNYPNPANYTYVEY